METITTQTLAEGFKFLEGPRWHEDRIWMSDVVGRKVFTLDLLGKVDEVVAVPGMPSGLGFLPDGTPLVVSMADRCLFRLEGGKLVRHAALDSLVTGPTNDMVADEQGRAYVGGYGFDAWVGEEFRPGNLVLVTPDGEARVVAEDLAGPNGTVILRNRALLVVAETRGRKLTAFDVAADGALSGRRVYADLGEHMPDGICLDEGGGIWVASFRGGVSCASSKAGPSAIVSTSPDAWRSPVSWAARMAARSFVSPVRALGRMFAPAARGRLSKSRKSMSPGRAHREVGQTALESLISIGMGLLGGNWWPAAVTPLGARWRAAHSSQAASRSSSKSLKAFLFIAAPAP